MGLLSVKHLTDYQNRAHYFFLEFHSSPLEETFDLLLHIAIYKIEKKRETKDVKRQTRNERRKGNLELRVSSNKY